MEEKGRREDTDVREAEKCTVQYPPVGLGWGSSAADASPLSLEERFIQYTEPRPNYTTVDWTIYVVARSMVFYHKRWA